MANLEVIRGFVAQALADAQDIGGSVERDEDGDFRIRRGSASYWVTAVDTDDGEGLVQVGSTVLRGVPLSKKALQAVNSINCEYLWVRARWDDELIIVARDIPAQLVTGRLLAETCAFIGGIADGKDDQFKELLSVGTTAYDGDPEDDSDDDVQV